MHSDLTTTETTKVVNETIHSEWSLTPKDHSQAAADANGQQKIALTQPPPEAEPEPDVPAALTAAPPGPDLAVAGHVDMPEGEDQADPHIESARPPPPHLTSGSSSMGALFPNVFNSW